MAGERRDTALIRIAICEDEPVFLERLKNMAAGILDKYAAAYSIEVFTNGTPLLTRGTFDILLLDIEMQPYNGIELARKLRERHEEGRIIFITAYEQYAIEAYDVQAFHYLLKPVEEGKLEETLVKACDLLKKEEDQGITVRQGGLVRRIPFQDVLYLEVIDRKVYLHTACEVISFYRKLEELVRTLPDVFFRCHRSYVVNLSYVLSYDKRDVRLNNGESIPLSKRRRQLFGLAFMQHLKESGDVF
jgi:two-component system response regulator LytT